MQKQFHMGSVGDEAKKFFDDSRDQSKGAIDLFIKGVAQGLLDVDKNWTNKTPKEQMKRFEKVFDTAKERMVCKSDGGGCDNDNGLSISTFNSYKSLAKKVHIFRTRWQNAKNRNNDELRVASRLRKGEDEHLTPTQTVALQKYVQYIEKEKEKQTDLTTEDQMDFALLALDEACAEKGAKKEEKKPLNKEGSTPWTLPDPDEFEESLILDEGIKIVVDYFEQTKLSKLVNANTPEGQAVRRVLGEFHAYLKSKEADAA